MNRFVGGKTDRRRYLMARQQLEYQLQKAVCQYLNMQYPKVPFFSTGVSLKLTMPQAVRFKAINKDSFKVPDLFIPHPLNGLLGLFLEVKKTTPFKKSGEIKKSQNNHLELQWKAINELNNRGYYAAFVWEFNQAKLLIDSYLRPIKKISEGKNKRL